MKLQLVVSLHLYALCAGWVAVDAAPGRQPVPALSFRAILAGQFRMGSTDGTPEEAPVHVVKLTRGFEIGVHEVTQGQWESVMGVNPSRFRGAERPVENVSWDDAQQFLAALNRLGDGYHYRLPTEAEWEYAARAGSDAVRPTPMREVAWYRGNSGGETQPVGGKRPNAWGLYDMVGNIGEWCQDRYGPDYYGASSAEDPRGPERGDCRVVRGGTFGLDEWHLRFSFRSPVPPGFRFEDFGFRCAREKLAEGDAGHGRSSTGATSDVAGRWEGTLDLRFSNGGTQSQPVSLVLRQFGSLVQGTFAFGRSPTGRLRSATLAGNALRVATSGFSLELALTGDRLSGPAVFEGSGAPKGEASLQRLERGNGGVKEPERPSAVGDIRKIDDFAMPQLGRSRRLWIYLPRGYDTTSHRYPVLYMPDAQNLFDTLTSDRGEWRVDEALEAQVASGRSRGVIVVGIEHGGRHRAQEYTPAALGLMPGAEGELFARFVVETLKPYVDAHYRTLPDRENAAVAGASAGAQIAFFIGTEYPEVFSKVGALGFAMGRGAREACARWRATHRHQAPMRIYLHVGTAEGLGSPEDDRMFVEHLRAQQAALRAIGYGQREVRLDIERGARHNERFWSRRFPGMLAWLFG
jgi:formylglycine-generating enzyme required for sulfatase activity/predicted alpha/beta superfamily hydrolase